jgi:hypothetical protein
MLGTHAAAQTSNINRRKEAAAAAGVLSIELRLLLLDQQQAWGRAQH